MTTTTKFMTGFEIPNLLKSKTILLFAASFWASMIFQANFGPGSVIVLSFLAPLVMIWQSHDLQKMSQNHYAMLGATFAVLLGVALEPGWLNLLVAWFFLSVTAVIFRTESDVSPQVIFASTVWQILKSPASAVSDFLNNVSRNLDILPRLLGARMSGYILPVVTFSVFLGLLVIANPVIENLFSALTMVSLARFLVNTIDTVFSLTLVIAIIFSIALWPALRGTEKPTELDQATATIPNWHNAYFKSSAVGLTLILLNGLFAVETWLDLSHVWFSDVPPAGFTQAEYVHRGAYSLIATAILAGLLVMFALRRGSATEANPIVRNLAYVFVVQNVLLVASSAKRTLTYIDAFGWTEWRLAGLIWMALVAFGLASVVWRLFYNRNGRWLIGMNLKATGVILIFCCLFDNSKFIAEQNVMRAQLNPKIPFDYRYAKGLSPTALPALYRLGIRWDTPGPEVQTFEDIVWRLKATQADWQSWTWRYWGLEK